MKRDDDFIRELLFEIEASDDPYLIADLVMSPSAEDLKRHMHAKWLSDAGLLLEENDGVFRITNQGHDYLAAIRDDGIWKKTKAAASRVPAFLMPSARRSPMPSRLAILCTRSATASTSP